MPTDAATGIYYELHGRGEPLFLGFPLFASYAQILGPESTAVLQGYLDRLTDRYRLLVCDYPSLGHSRTIPPDEFTAERALADMCAVADAAGFERFAWWGYSVGAAIGLQLASRTDRVTALAIGGWTPLGGPYAEMARAASVNVGNPPDYARKVLRSLDQYRQWTTFWGSLVGWPETAALARIRCPRLAFAGGNAVADGGGMIIPYGAILRSRQAELEALGWQVLVLEGRSHEEGVDPDVVVGPVSAFLDRALLLQRARVATRGTVQ